MFFTTFRAILFWQTQENVLHLNSFRIRDKIENSSTVLNVCMSIKHSNITFKILLHLPYSRKLEEEADEVGMLFAAKVGIENLCKSSTN